MHRVLMISPHFPPDTGAATHRVRLLAPHLTRYGWEPTVISVDPQDYEGRLDPELSELVPRSLRVVRCRAWPVRWTRQIGVGDLGLRAFRALYQTCVELLRRERFDAVFITIFPSYPALLGPLLSRKFGVAFVLDYQDPWVGAWGLTIGGGPDGRPDIKSRLSRILGTVLEPLALSAADAITAVSSATYKMIRARYPHLKQLPCMEIPLGGEPADFEYLRAKPRSNRYFDPTDGNCHICYTGTLLPLGFETLRAVLGAIALLRQRQPELYARLRLHFFGTSNQTTANAPQQVIPVARELGVSDFVTEIAPRIDYLDALTVQTQATAILMMGSIERHYTASKLYPGLLAKRPILAIYHETSTVVEILRRAARPPTARVVTYNDTVRAESRTEVIYSELSALAENPMYDPTTVDMTIVSEFSAQTLAGKLAAVLEQVRRHP